MKIRLGDIADVIEGQVAPKIFSEDGLPFIRAGHLKGLINGTSLKDLPKVNVEIADKERLKKLPKKSVLFAKIGMSATLNRIYLTKEECYIVRHLGAVLPNKNYISSFLAYYLLWYNTSNLIIDNAYPSIRLEDIKNLKIPFPSFTTQQKIVETLDTAAALRNKTKKLLEEYDLLAKSIFIDMFGDPVLNPRVWSMKQLKSLGKTITGNTPPRSKLEYYGEYIEWIKAGNINKQSVYLTQAEEYLSELGMSKGRIVEKGAILVTCTAGSIGAIGNVAVSDRKVSFNQQINAFIPFGFNPMFWYYLFTLAKRYVQSNSTNGVKGNISKGKFEKMEFINPPIELQEKFTQKIELIERQKEIVRQELKESEDFFEALLQRTFKGDL